MANIPTGKSDIKLRMKDSSIEALKLLSGQAGYPTHNLFAVELLEGCLQYLANPEQIRMPDILFNLRKKLSLKQLNELASNLKKEPDAREVLEQLLEQKIDAILARKLTGVGKRKKTG